MNALSQFAHRRAALLVGLLIVATPMAMLYPLWADPLSAGEDDVGVYYPLRTLVGHDIAAGQWPMQNALEATGAPLMGDPQSAVMFPATWAFAVMPARAAYSLSIFAAFAVAGLGAFVYLRRLGLVLPAACFGVLAFEFCGFFVGHRVHLGMIQTAGFLPWGLWCIELLRDRPWRGAAAVAAIGFLSLAAGHWAILTFMAVAWFAYFLLRARPILRALPAAGMGAVVAMLLAAPQLAASVELLAQTTRANLGYATVGANSFFPAAGVLAFFPFLMGSRTANVFTDAWWGPWHLCEMLGYVGLATLVLAMSAVWRLYRKPKPEIRNSKPEIPLVRIWTWIGLGVLVWMLGYYLPTYRLIYMLPVLGQVRCPARMVLVLDMALASLAAIAIHAAIQAQQDLPSELLRATIRRGAARTLQIAMLATLLLTAGVAWLACQLVTQRQAGMKLEFFGGTAEQAMRSLRPWNPAVWWPMILAAATVLVVRWWLAEPRARAAAMVLLLAVDLFIPARFVDVPAGGPRMRPEASPALAWLRENAPAGENFRVYGLARSYNDRSTELLLPKVCESVGVATIASDGPWQSPRHAHLLGFDTYGQNADWEWLIMRNHLLSLYGVRYVLAADMKFRRIIEDVRIDDAITPAGENVLTGENMLADKWTLDRAKLDGGTMSLGTPFMWLASSARQDGMVLENGRTYCVSLEARGRDRGAANFLRLAVESPGNKTIEHVIEAERIGTDWRRFEWMFQTADEQAAKAAIVLETRSERPIEVRNVQFCSAEKPRPINLGGKLAKGEPVYRQVALLPAANVTAPPVAIYENLLCQPVPTVERLNRSTNIESIKWPDDATIGRLTSPAGPVEVALPDVSVPIKAKPGKWVWAGVVPGAVLLAGLLVMGFRGFRRRGTFADPAA